MKTTRLIEKTVTIKVEELFEEFILEECETVWKKNITTKLNVSPNYYDLSIDDREKLLTLMNEWSKEELNKVAKIRTNNRSKV